MSDKMTKILAERGEQYGSYRSQAELSRAIRDLVLSHIKCEIPAYMEESINMISHKIARVANGNTHNVDSWRDIAGYATLVANLLEEENNGAEPAPVTRREGKSPTEKAGKSGVYVTDEPEGCQARF